MWSIFYHHHLGTIMITLVPSPPPWHHHDHLGTIMITLVGGRPFSTSLASRHNWRVRQSGGKPGNKRSWQCRWSWWKCKYWPWLWWAWSAWLLSKVMVTNIILVIFDGAVHGDEDCEWDNCCIHGNNIKSRDEFQSCHRCARAGWFIIGGII